MRGAAAGASLCTIDFLGGAHCSSPCVHSRLRAFLWNRACGPVVFETMYRDALM